MSAATPTHRVLATDIRPGDLLIGHAVGGALADLSNCPPRLVCGTVSATSGPDTIQCALRKAPVVDLILHGGWCSEMRIDADRYYDVRRAVAS